MNPTPKNKDKRNDAMEKLVSLAKRRGFIFQGSEIYGGLAGTYDFGPLGVMLKNNITSLWWKRFVDDRDDMYGIDAAILMNQNVWKASGHVATFADPLVEDLKTKKRHRADHLLEDAGIDVRGMSAQAMDALIKEKKILSPDGNALGDVRQFNMMFKTNVGPSADDDSITYLRPETAGGLFVNFKNVLDTFHPKLPFGLAQIGKAFRNEIAPRDFIFRLRELAQMEIEYFVKPSEWEKYFEHFRLQIHEFISKDLGLSGEKVHELEIADVDRAHYSKRTIDFEFDFPFGRKELYGLAYRTDFDLRQHSMASGVDLSYFDEETKERFIPHCIEPSFGLERTLLAVLANAYQEDSLGAEAGDEGKGEVRVYLKFAPKVAPIKVAVFPLLKNKPILVDKAREVYMMIKKDLVENCGVAASSIVFDDNGNIGKRYRRQDEVGTPYCVTVDFETVENVDPQTGPTVTLRDRDSGKQERITLPVLTERLRSTFKRS